MMFRGTNSRRLAAVLAVLLLILTGAACSQYKSNGQRIYLNGTSASGQPITPGGFSTPMFTMTCGNCHLADGRGGPITIMMARYQVPNITWPVLIRATEDHPAYTEATLKTAITTGAEPGGERLLYPMPTWQMSSRDLKDLVGFIKTLK